MNLKENIRRVLREEYIPTQTEYLGWDIPRKLYDELEDIGIKRWDKENDKVYIAEFQFDTKSVVFEILDSTGEAYFNSLFPIPLSYKSYHTKKIKDLPISIKYFILRRFEQEWVNIMDKYDDDGKIIQESIRRILREEDYSPAGKEIIPNSIIVHKSNPMFRDKIMEEGLKVRAGECYKIFVGYGVKCKPAIFATNSTNKRAWFDSTYDDDIWFIDTRMIPDVKWYKDRHFESTKKHIVTFQDIPKEAITLHYEGTGSGDVKKWDKDSPNIVRESIRNIVREKISQKGKDKLINMIKTIGIENTAKAVGGTNNLMKILNINSPMEFLHLFDDLDVVQSEEKPDWILFRYEPKHNLIIYVRKHDLVFINYDKIWEVLEDVFNLKNSEIKELTQEWLSEVYNIRGVTPTDGRYMDSFKLSEVYNLREETKINTFIRRRVPIDDLEREFSESLEMSSNMLRNTNKEGGGVMSLNRFTDITISILIDWIYYELYSTMPDDYQWYDEVQENLKEYYRGRIEAKYRKLMSEI